MKNIFKKILCGLAPLMFASGSISADSSLDCNPCEPVCETSCWCGSAFLSAEFIYLKAFEEGFSCACPDQITDSTTSGGFVISRLKGEGKSPHFEWTPGYRIGTGYVFNDLCWDVGVYWTHLNSRAHRKVSDNHFHWKMDYDTVDLVVGYDMQMNSCITVRPYGGVRYAKIRQNTRTHSTNNTYTGNGSSFSSSGSEDGYDYNYTYSDPIAADLIIVDGHGKHKFYGVGPFLGLEGDWNIGCNFSFYVNADVGTLFGHHHVDLNFETQFTDAAQYSTSIENSHARLLFADFGLGVRWTKCLCNEMELSLTVGLESHRYFDFNHLGERDDLSLDGACVGVGIQF